MKLKAIFTLISLLTINVTYSQLISPLSITAVQNNNIISHGSSEKWLLESFGEWDQAQEDISLRDQNAKHFKNADGSYTAIIAAGNLHYWENNQWKTIFHSIDQTAGGFQNLTNNHKTYYPKLSSGSITTILPNGNELKDMIGIRMFFEVNGFESNSQNIAGSTGSVDFNTLTYTNVFGPGINLRLTQETTKRKMDYIISNINALGSIPTGANNLVFEEKVELPVGWIAELIDNNIYLKDVTGLVMAIYENPVFKDAPQLDSEGHSHSDEAEGVYTITLSGNILTIQTKVQLSWLTDPERAFPVVIDPTVNVYPDNSSWWTGHIHTNSGTPTAYTSTSIVAGNDNNMRLGKGTSGSENNNCYHSWAKFNSSSLSGLCISSVNLNVTPYDNDGVIGSGCFVNVSIRPLASDPVSATNANRLTDIRDGSSYNNIVFTSANESGLQSFSLGSSGVTNLTSSISSGWFGVGLNTTAVQSGHYDYLWIQPHSSANKPYLSVVYATVNAGTDVTICNGTNIVLNGSVTDASSSSTNSGSANFNYTGSGYDYPGFGIGGMTSGMPANATITSVSITGSTGNSCSWTSMDFYVNGSYINWYCSGTWTYNGLNGALANGQTFQIYSYDEDWWDDYITMTLSVTVNYTYTNVSSPTISWSGSSIVSGGNTLTPTVNPTNTTTYTVTATTNGCNVTDQVTVTVLPTASSPTSVSATHPLHPAYCHGNTINLTSVGGTAAGSGIVDVWFENSCNTVLQETWSSSPVGRPGWWIGSTTVNSANGILNVTSTGVDPMIYMGNLSINPAVYRYVQVRYRYVSGPTNSGMQVFFENGSGLAESRSQRGTMIMDGSWHYMNLDMSVNYSGANSGWSGGPTVTGLRFDFCEATGMVMEFDFLLVSQDRMVGDQTTLTLSPSSPYYPTVSTQYFTRKIDNCGTTSCASTNVNLPPLGTTLALDNEAATCYVYANETIKYYHSSGRYIATVTAGTTNLGSTVATAYLEPSYLLVPACNMPSEDIAVMQRHWVITPTSNGPATVRLPYYTSELANLGAGSLVSTSGTDLIVSPDNTNVLLSKYSGGAFPATTNVNDNPYDNCTVGGTVLYNNVGIGTNTPVPNINAMYSDFSIPGFSEFWLHGNSNLSPLPITLTSFAAICDESKDEVKLQWLTASEHNTSHFVVERSFNGTLWDELGIKAAAGNSTSSLTYEMTDKEVRGYDVIYYRLKQVDLNGQTETFGPTVAECLWNENGFELFPNPAEDNVTIKLKGEFDPESTYLNLEDVNGKVLKRIDYTEQTSSLLQVDLKELAPGVYIVRLVEGSDNVQMVRLIKQ